MSTGGSDGFAAFAANVGARMSDAMLFVREYDLQNRRALCTLLEREAVTTSSPGLAAAATLGEEK